MPEDTDVCRKFMKEVAPFVGKFSKRMFVLLDYSVDDEAFVIKISYSKDNSEHLIQEFVCDMIDELKKSELSKHCWATHHILCEEVEIDEYSQPAVKLLVVRE